MRIAVFNCFGCHKPLYLTSLQQEMHAKKHLDCLQVRLPNRGLDWQYSFFPNFLGFCFWNLFWSWAPAVFRFSLQRKLLPLTIFEVVASNKRDLSSLVAFYKRRVLFLCSALRYLSISSWNGIFRSRDRQLHRRLPRFQGFVVMKSLLGSLNCFLSLD